MSGGPVDSQNQPDGAGSRQTDGPRKPTILVVTEDSEPSEAMSAWLREAGLRVLACPGPQPRPMSVPVTGRRCPFAVGADVVVLDLWLASDTMLRGTPAMQLLS
jgi:hypothetical protein